jgi:hypothetical protein
LERGNINCLESCTKHVVHEAKTRSIRTNRNLGYAYIVLVAYSFQVGSVLQACAAEDGGTFQTIRGKVVPTLNTTRIDHTDVDLLLIFEPSDSLLKVQTLDRVRPKEDGAFELKCPHNVDLRRGYLLIVMLPTDIRALVAYDSGF